MVISPSLHFCSQNYSYTC